MKNYFLYVFISLFLFFLSSCKDDKDVVAVLELGLENADFYKEAGSVVIDVKITSCRLDRFCGCGRRTVV